MFTINSLNGSYAVNFEGEYGLLACLLYSTGHTAMRELIRRQWSGMSRWSNKHVLIAVADEEEREEKPSRRVVPEMRRGHINESRWLTTMDLPGSIPGRRKTASDIDKLNYEMAEALGVGMSCMPCMVFFNTLSNTDTLVFSFKPAESVAELHQNMLEIFEHCKEVVGDGNAYGEADLVEWRKRKMIELEPRLNGLKFPRLAKHVGRHPLVPGLARLFTA